jgi:hypothetical protein
VSSTTGGKYFLVKNFVNDSSFFEWNQFSAAASLLAVGAISSKQAHIRIVTCSQAPTLRPLGLTFRSSTYP